MQDAFAVLFFVSVGMLFNPHVLISHPGGVAAVVAVVIFGKALAALAVVMVLGYPVLTGLSMAAALARIGEFSFILAGLGISTGVMPVEGRDLIVAAALISITLSSLVFAATDALVPVVRTIHGLRGYGQRRLARLQDELDVVLRKAEAREEEHSVEIRNIVDLFPVFGELDKHAMEDLLLLFQPASANPETGCFARATRRLPPISSRAARSRFRRQDGRYCSDRGILRRDGLAERSAPQRQRDRHRFLPVLHAHPA